MGRFLGALAASAAVLAAPLAALAQAPDTSHPPTIAFDNAAFGKLLGISGHKMGQFRWSCSLACPSENVVFVADMNNWRVEKIALRPERATGAKP